MSNDTKNPTSRRRVLSEEEAQLWARVASTTEPLDDRSERQVPKGETETPHHAPKTNAKKPAAKSTSFSPAPKASANNNQSNSPQPDTFNRREARKIRSGRTEIDARIDLHGMRQHEAHSALNAFLYRSYSAGHRYVLVITGKGSVRDTGESESFFEERDRGVLKRQVPQWLDEPALRSMVVSYQSAHQHHGGEGALYVRLRRADRPR